ncbi:nicotinate-nucleotide--dimethylbenzimidazole phosphoribosyltransferase [Paenibacillus turpanensis]|uniref:nicotinate-nucleotide--dimethylbenzimidazole phosphoribosyltransferase n=1 Tax=Paenibacillus turpanensis TaxID=2689078 RepID=UPI00140D104F|nr:nicotinate-nucleotide--dimethylbenzimidazole phosphoribosyltransferase [Paenibacillus turpanensis]
MNRLDMLIGGLQPLDREAMASAMQQLDRLTKPPGSLGRLEELAIQLAGITGELQPDLSRKAVVVMAGDHGVCAEGVSAFPQEVTPQMVLNFLNGGAGVNVLARHTGADVLCVDVGVLADVDHPELIVRKVRNGTRNMAVEPAMTEKETEQALLVGVDLANQLKDEGYRLIATGEMGIGNTTPSAAMLSVFANLPPEECVGRGTGLNDEAVRRKAEVVRRAIEINRPQADQPLDVLAKVGGLEIAALTGLILGAAANRIPVVIDGFISSAAALAAVRLSHGEVTNYLIPSHLSGERGHTLQLQQLRLKPMLQLDMRLGEGTGAVMCFPIIEAALKLMNEMATFDSAGVSSGK